MSSSGDQQEGSMGNRIYQGDIDALAGHDPFGSGECVALVQAVTSVGHTSTWRPGPRVVDLSYLNPGTVIANFIDGRFPNRHGYHAALFVEFGPRDMASRRPTKFTVMDQFTGRYPRNVVKPRDIIARGDRTKAMGNPYADCDNADQFYVVFA
jgi:hypothetical protein